MTARPATSQQIGRRGSRDRLAEHAAGGEEIIRHQDRRAHGLPRAVAVIDDLDRRKKASMACATVSAVNGASEGTRSRPSRTAISHSTPTRTKSVWRSDTPTVVHAVGKHAAAAGMRNLDIVLHHRAGAADLVAAVRAEIGRQQTGQRRLNPVSLGFGLVARSAAAAKRRGSGMRRRWRAAAMIVHRRRRACNTGQTKKCPHAASNPTRRDKPSRAFRGAPALPPTASRSGGLRAASARSARRSPRNSRRCCRRCAAAPRRSWRSACAGGRGRAARWRGRFRTRRGRPDPDD